MNKLIRITTVPISLDKLLDKQMGFMKDHYQVIAVSSDAAYMKKIGQKEGIEIYCVEMTRQITPLQDLKSLLRLYRFFKKEKPLIVHTHTPKAGTVGMIAARLANVPHRLHTVAGLPLLEATGMKRKLLNLVEKITYKCSTHVYPNSKGLKEIIVKEQFCPASKLKVIADGSSNGINIAYFDPSLFSDEQKGRLKKELGISDKDFIFIFVGRLVGDKGINELITAFETISKKNSHAKLLLVGPQEPQLDPLDDNTLQILSHNSNIVAIGFQSDVRPYLAISDVLAFPSYREGFPNVVMQAGAMGLPAIVTDINGCNEIVENNVNGVIIPPKNASELQTTMEKYLTDNNLFTKHKSVAREMITSRYEQKVVWEALLNEYKMLENQNQ